MKPIKKANPIEKEHYGHLERRLFDMTALLDVSQALNSSLDIGAILDTILLTILGKFACQRGMVLLYQKDNAFQVESIRGQIQGVQDGDIVEIPFTIDQPQQFSNTEIAAFGLEQWEVGCFVPIRKYNHTVGLLALGEKGRHYQISSASQTYTPVEIEFLISLANIAATSIENAQVYRQVKGLNRQLDLKIQELNSLFEIGEELNSGFDPARILQVLTLTLMGQMAISKCCVLQPDEQNPTEVQISIKKGLDREKFTLERIQACSFKTLFDDLNMAAYVPELSQKSVQEFCLDAGITHLIPMQIKHKTRGILGVGGKLNDKTMRPFGDNELAYLNMLANQTMIALENARLFQTELEKKHLEKELNLARQIQRSLLPSQNPTYPGFEIAGVNIPSMQVGGDYYGFLKVDADRLGLAIADVTGKGIPASLFMANLHAYLQALITVEPALSGMIVKINDWLHGTAGATGRYITFACCVLNLQTRELVYTNAGHNFPVIFHPDGKKTHLEEGGLPLGMFPGMPYFEKQHQLQTGDVLLLYTDGVSEAMNGKEEEYQEDRLENLVAGHTAKPASEIVERIVEDVRTFVAGAPQSDDITIIVVKVL